MLHPERLTRTGITGTNWKGWKVYQISLQDLILSCTRR